jgi:hypothetical protein
MAPYAHFNLLKFRDKDHALEKIEDLTLFSDILPTGYDGGVKAGVTTGSTVYVAGAGSGRACLCRIMPVVGSRPSYRGGYDSRTSRAGTKFRMRDHRPARAGSARRAHSPDRRCPRGRRRLIG